MHILSADLPEEQCLYEVGSKPSALDRTDAPKELQLFRNYRFPCDGEVQSWIYYRSSTGHDSYVTVWRYYSLNGNDNQFRMISKTNLPDAAVGVHTVRLNTPILVQKGDFIGIVHESQAPNSQLPYCEQANDTCPGGLYSPVLTINIYSNSLSVGSSVFQSYVHGRSTVNRLIPISAILRMGMYHKQDKRSNKHCTRYIHKSE